MAITIHEQSPYFDDYASSGVEDKNYLKILFKPGISVQVRELNQLQSVIQSQIDKFGRSIYVDGTPVIGGVPTFDNNISYVDVLIDSDGPSSEATIKENIAQIKRLRFTYSAGKIIVGDILGYKELPTIDTYRFYIRYANSIQNADGDNVSNFTTGGDLFNAQAVTNEDESELIIANGLKIGSVIETGGASGVFVPYGVFFVKGCFVVSEAQSVFMDSQDVSGFAVFSVDESIVTYAQDPSLLDNAGGAPNYNAPGADRYAVSLSLLFVDEDEMLDGSTKYVKLLDISNSKLNSVVKTEYTNLDRILAQRTSEESGDYVVRPFAIDHREMYNDGSNRGRYTADELEAIFPDISTSPNRIAAARAKYSVGIEPSVAYVSGYRIELISKKEINADKARDTGTVSNVYFSTLQGNYIEGTIANASTALPDVKNPSWTYDLKDGSAATIGSCRIRGVEHVSGATYKLFIFDLALNSGKKLADAQSIVGHNFTFTNSSGFYLLDATANRALFELPYTAVQALDNTNVRYKVREHATITPTLVSSGGGSYNYSITINAPSGYFFFDDTPINYLILRPGVGVVVPSGVTVTNTTSGSEVVITFTATATVASVYIQYSLEAVNLSPKTKTIVTTTQDFASIGGGTTSFALTNYDIIGINSIFVIASGSPTGSDLKGDFELDNGSRDNYYTTGSLKYKGSASLAGKTIRVSYRYYNHGSTGDYFSVNSYTGTNYDDIPVYAGTRLSDVLDFRPKLNSSASRPIDPNSVAVVGLTRYLPRIDKVIVNTTGEFKIITGISSDQPKVPATPDGSMALYNLFVPAYTFSTSDIKVTFIDNKRYTMRDIGYLEKRISNLEYYTSLSLLEKDSVSKQILDGSGVDRYKNGIIVDSFVGHSVGSVTNPGYACSVDPESGVLRPMYNSKNVPFRYVSGTAHRVNENTISLDFIEKVLVAQSFASSTVSVNPYEVANWGGVLDLSPSSDEWKSTTRRPDVIVNDNGTYDAIAYLAESTNVLGTQWNEWETAWTGVTTRTVSKKHSVKPPGKDKKMQSITASTSSGEIRDGLKTTLTYADVQTSLGDSIVDISYVPFIRSRKVYFKSKLLKPGTRVYAFFDGVDVSDYVHLESFVNFGSSDNVAEYNDLTAAQIGIVSAPLITSDTGSIEGSFIIPNNNSLRFKTGARVFKLTDSPTNNDATADTSAEFSYTAAGLLETVQGTIISTRVPEFVTERVEETRTVTTTTVKYVDPIAQSFIIGNLPTGCFLTSVDLFFAKKSSKNIPIYVQIVSVENGIPTQKIVPFSKVVLDAADVDVSEDSSTATNFAFSDPVYLQCGVEYAIVVISNDPDYKLWISEVGGVDALSGQLISKNPYSGVMFKSQNASTWTPEQTMDLKFTLNRADFVSAAAVEFDSLISGKITSITVGTAGSGYTVPPVVSIEAPTSGTTATATAVLTDAGGVARIVITNPGSGYAFAPAVTIAAPPSGTTALATAKNETIDFSLFNIVTSTNVTDSTGIDWDITIPGFQTDAQILVGENYELYERQSLALGDEIRLSGDLRTDNSLISPIIDLDRLSAIVIDNIINDDVTGELTGNASAAARYITKIVELNNPADQIDIYILANRPTSECDIKVYVKALSNESVDETTVNWEEVIPSTAIPVSADSSVYGEVHYIYTSTPEEFTQFEVKIVMVSSNTAVIPTVKDFRAIATY